MLRRGALSSQVFIALHCFTRYIVKPGLSRSNSDCLVLHNCAVDTALDTKRPSPRLYDNGATTDLPTGETATTMASFA